MRRRALAAATGQYAIGVSCSDEICVNGSTFTVQLGGNTATIPEPSTALLLGIGTACSCTRAACRTPALPTAGQYVAVGLAPLRTLARIAHYLPNETRVIVR